MAIVGLWIICGVLAAALLSRHDRAGTGCLLGLVLGPIGIIIAWAMRDHARAGARRAERQCPHCAETIIAEAHVCRHCGRDVDAAAGVVS